MPKVVVNALDAMQVKKETRPGYHADGGGLYLLVAKNGYGYFVWRGTVQGRRQELGIGPARDVKLKDARETARQWRNIARAGGDPKAERDKNKRKAITFAEAARQVHKEQVAPQAKNPKHAMQWLTTLEVYAFPVIGALPVHTIDSGDILKVLAPIWTEKAETARRVRQRMRTVFDWAATAKLREGVNPVQGVDKGLPRQRDRVQHHRALPYAELPAVMRRIEAVDGMGALALRFAILTAARSGEVRGAMWPEIDADARLWTVPEDRMKGGREHRVPLSEPALAVLDHVRGLSDDLIFPSMKPGVPLSDMTVSAVLRRLEVPATPHGMRSCFRDWAEELTGFSYEVKEAALAHVVKSATERAYRRGDLLDKRRALMEQWGRFCTSAASTGDVVEFRR